MKNKVPPSQFLRTLDPYMVYDHENLAMDFANEVGMEPCWPAHSAVRAQLDIMAACEKATGDTSGAWMNTKDPHARVAYGWEIAQSVADKLCTVEHDDVDFTPEGRFETCISTLEDTGK